MNFTWGQGPEPQSRGESTTRLKEPQPPPLTWACASSLEQGTCLRARLQLVTSLSQGIETRSIACVAQIQHSRYSGDNTNNNNGLGKTNGFENKV